MKNYFFSSSFINGVIYSLSWFLLIYFGARGHQTLALDVAFIGYVAQILLFVKTDPKSLRASLPLSMIALGLGLLQEAFLIHWQVLTYSNESFIPPFWLLALYPLFALTLNSSLSFLNRNLLYPLFLGGIGAILSYRSGENLNGVQLSLPIAYPVIFISWGIFLTILVIINRKIIRS